MGTHRNVGSQENDGKSPKVGGECQKWDVIKSGKSMKKWEVKKNEEGDQKWEII